MKSTSAIHSTITKNMKDLLVKRAPCISISESHNTSISAMPNSFHNIIAVRSVSAIFMRPLRANHKSSPIRSCEETMETQRGTKVAP